MEELEGRVAVVTGAASGIGYALAERFLAEGMRTVLADVEEGALERATTTLDPDGEHTLAVATDVSAWESVAALAEATYDAFGAAHVVCNNAGVAGAAGRGGGIWTRDLRDWQWMLGVNLWGAIHGVRAFLPRMLEQGDEGHIVNTGSMAGLVHGSSIYSVTKHAVVAFSEALYLQLSGTRAKVGVSVLCPGVVQTNILDAERNRPAHLAVEVKPEDERARAADGRARRGMESGQQPAEVAAEVAAAIRARRFYVLPMHQQIEEGFARAVRQRAEAIVARENPRAGSP